MPTPEEIRKQIAEGKEEKPPSDLDTLKEGSEETPPPEPAKPEKEPEFHKCPDCKTNLSAIRIGEDKDGNEITAKDIAVCENCGSQWGPKEDE